MLKAPFRSNLPPQGQSLSGLLTTFDLMMLARWIHVVMELVVCPCSLPYSLPLAVSRSHFIYSIVDGHLGNFLFGAIKNNSVNILAYIF